MVTFAARIACLLLCLFFYACFVGFALLGATGFYLQWTADGFSLSAFALTIGCIVCSMFAVLAGGECWRSFRRPYLYL